MPTSGAGPACRVVETALAKALELAAQAQRWDLVRQIFAELKARRLARAGTFGALQPLTPGTSIR